MSLSRKLLESLGLEADKVSTIIEAHAETVDGLKAEIEKYKTGAESYDSTKAELEKVKAELAGLKDGGADWQKKYEAEHKAFEAYKSDLETKETLTTKKTAYEALLKETGVSDKSIAKIMKLTDFDTIELEDGAIKDLESVTEAIKTEWGDFITNSQTSGADTQVPPANNTTRFTSDEIAKMSPDEINENWEAIKESMKK